ncbi:unnamed protein product [Somion occarium]|uniref:Jacalin-type lectin domain-containing protein n=1 Tax=Somion occarium TaxID=3059160 RepID=A0ABP1DHL8_9APHY
MRTPNLLQEDHFTYKKSPNASHNSGFGHIKAAALDNSHIVQTPTWGSAGGVAFNNLNDIGQQNVNKISQIVIRHGVVIDNIAATYQRSGGLAPVTLENGGTGGNVTTINLSGDEFVIAVTAAQRFVSTGYGPTSVQNLRIFILNKSTNVTRIEGPFAPGSGTEFVATGTVVAFAGNIATVGTRFIQALSFFISPTPIPV